MATPTYQGAGQPVVTSGWLSGLTSWFGGSTPAYKGAGQPASGASSWGGPAPAYKPAPATPSSPVSAPGVQGEPPPGAIVLVPCDVIETQS